MSKKAERRWKTEKKISSRLQYLNNIYTNIGLPIPKNKMGRCKKHHPYDCGHTKCFCCHSDKIGHKPLRQQILSNLYFKEEMEKF